MSLKFQISVARLLVCLLTTCSLFPLLGADQVLPLVVPQSSGWEGNYSVILVAKKDVNGLYKSFEYQIVDLTSKRVLAVLPCSYQPEKKVTPWAIQNAQGAEAYWNSQAHQLALNEANYRFGGSVFIVDLTSQNHPNAVKLTNADIEKSLNGTIDRCRIVVRDGWNSKNELSLGIAGYLTDPSGKYTHFDKEGVATFTNGKVQVELLP